MEKYPQLINQSDNSVVIVNNAMFCVGRSLTCDHIIESLDVSRFHCIIKKINDEWMLCDRSTNGTIVNSKLYTFNQNTHLKDGDTIKLGASNVSFIFRKSKETNQELENNENPSCTTVVPSVVFPDDEVLIEEAAAALLAEGVEEVHDRGELLEADSVEKKGVQNCDIIDDELTCSICSELFIKAVTLNCSHTFCQYCINKWKESKSKCPICRDHITNVSSTLVLDNFIEKVIERQNEKVKETRKQLVKQREKLAANKANSSTVVVNEDSPIMLDDYDEDSQDEDSDINNYFTDSEEADTDDNRFGRRRRPYYGGYGNCFVCYQPGHWANSCPFK